MSSFYKSLKNLIDGTKPKSEVEVDIIKDENIHVTLTPYEENLNILYMGCYNVDPVKPIITTELANVHNQGTCITAGQKAEYKYVALQDGNTCLATNNPDFSGMESVSRSKCNMVCDESSAGFCGGVFKNQIYATSIVHAIGNEHSEALVNSTVAPIPLKKVTKKSDAKPEGESGSKPKGESGSKTEGESGSKTEAETVSEFKKETFRHLENFASHNREMNSIGNNISQTDMVCQDPINKYNLFLSLLIIILLGHILFGMIYKKNKIY
jgi:hypothetical protein